MAKVESKNYERLYFRRGRSIEIITISESTKYTKEIKIRVKILTTYIECRQRYRLLKKSFFSGYISQRAEAILNEFSNNINKTYTGLISVLQGFQKCIA